MNMESNPTQTSPDRTPLHTAVEARDKREVERLLRTTVDCDAQDGQGRTPLHLAASQGSKKIVKLLLASGADVAVQDTRGYTPAQQAAFHGHTAITEILNGKALSKRQKVQFKRNYRAAMLSGFITALFGCVLALFGLGIERGRLFGGGVLLTLVGLGTIGTGILDWFWQGRRL